MTVEDVKGLDPEARDYYYFVLGGHKQTSWDEEWAITKALYDLEEYLKKRKENEE